MTYFNKQTNKKLNFTLKNNTGKIRIIAGKYKSRQIEFPTRNTSNLRPTSDRLRETLFNWLRPFIVDTNCLDAFAGSGALGFEALSRLAKCCDFFDLDSEAIKQLQLNKQKLQADNATMYQTSVLKHLSNPLDYQVIFLDPPFQSDLLDQALRLISANNSLTDSSLIYIEYASKRPPQSLVEFNILKQTKQGEVSACLLQKNASE